MDSTVVACYNRPLLHFQKRIMKIVLSLLLLWLSAPVWSQGHKLEFTIANFEEEECLLAYYIGDKMYPEDTASLNADGRFVFEGSEPLESGMYLLLSIEGKSKLIEFLVDAKNQHFHIQWDKNTKQEDLKVENSAENELFQAYLEYVAAKNKEGEALMADIQLANAAQKPALQAQLQALQKEVRQYQFEVAKKHPQSFTGALLTSNLDPIVPPRDQWPEGDSTFGYRVYKTHFFDNMHWDDHRLIRTPVLRTRINNYIDRLTPKQLDSVKTSVDYLVEQAEKGGNKKVYQFVVSELLNRYTRPRQICIDDAVYVHIGRKYYCDKQVEWVAPEQLRKICHDVGALSRVLCQQPAPSLKMRTLEGEPIQLRDVEAKLTVLFFWDPTCGNCAKASKTLLPIYEKYKAQGVEVFGVCTKSWDELKECQDAQKEKGMTWTNVTDTKIINARAKRDYNLKAIPTIFILDENKNILWNRLTAEQVEQVLQRELSNL